MVNNGTFDVEALFREAERQVKLKRQFKEAKYRINERNGLFRVIEIKSGKTVLRTYESRLAEGKWARLQAPKNRRPIILVDKDEFGNVYKVLRGNGKEFMGTYDKELAKLELEKLKKLEYVK